MTLTPPKALLFDWDNTLVDTWPIIYDALHETMSKWQMVPWTLDEVKLRVGKSLRDAFPDMFGDAWEEAGEFYMAAYRSRHLSELRPLPDVIPMLDYARAHMPYMALVSNKKGENLRLEVAHLGWGHYFDALIGAGDASYDKPHIAPAAMALEKAGLAMGKDIWFIGDTTTDLECAQSGGMRAVLYGDVAIEKAGMYRGFPYAHLARDHQEMLALFKSIC